MSLNICAHLPCKNKQIRLWTQNSSPWWFSLSLSSSFADLAVGCVGYIYQDPSAGFIIYLTFAFLNDPLIVQSVSLCSLCFGPVLSASSWHPLAGDYSVFYFTSLSLYFSSLLTFWPELPARVGSPLCRSSSLLSSCFILRVVSSSGKVTRWCLHYSTPRLFCTVSWISSH